MYKHSIIVAAILSLGIISMAFILTKNDSLDTQVVTNDVEENNVTMQDGKQIIAINARGGYTPRSSVAKAGIPTIVRFNTSGTFDCSASVRIPSLNISKILPQTGETDIDLGIPVVGPLSGSCGMGMYPFDITFVE